MPTEAFDVELSMLETMYPEEITWHSKNNELLYKLKDTHSSFAIRIPDEYPGSVLPEVVVATIHKQDVRDQLQKHLKLCDRELPIMDVMIDSFRTMVDGLEDHEPGGEELSVNNIEADDKLTAVIWLHHLLNTLKRKQVVSPFLDGISGVSKPGYPGVLIFSGPASAVSRHVEELKGLRWQGFQVRLEVQEEWRFKHGTGVLEVESMADVVVEVGEDHKQDLLEAVMRQ